MSRAGLLAIGTLLVILAAVTGVVAARVEDTSTQGLAIGAVVLFLFGSLCIWLGLRKRGDSDTQSFVSAEGASIWRELVRLPLFWIGLVVAIAGKIAKEQAGEQALIGGGVVGIVLVLAAVRKARERAAVAAAAPPRDGFVRGATVSFRCSNGSIANGVIDSVRPGQCCCRLESGRRIWVSVADIVQ